MRWNETRIHDSMPNREKGLTRKWMGERKLYSPCGPLPPATSEHSWVIESQNGYSSNGTLHQKVRLTTDVMHKEGSSNNSQSNLPFDILPSASPAWEKFDGKAEESQTNTPGGGPALTIPKELDHRFFEWNAPRRFSESLFDKKVCV